MITFLRKLFRRDVTITITPIIVPPNHGVVFTTRDYISEENAQRVQEALKTAGFPECVLVCGGDHAYTIDTTKGFE